MGWDATRIPLQKIYISADKTKLLEVVNNTAAYLFKGITSDILDNEGNFSHKKVVWQKDVTIKRFPKLL